jgi:hypothetical protein
MSQQRVENRAFFQFVGTIDAFHLTRRQVSLHALGPQVGALAHAFASVRRPFSADRRKVTGTDCA